ncbi:unnamed protein product [Clavelina lepadiformis]|uniref:GB1/RHD3-type G domain-containing protein n=1 Tax=Clavelina lepadiformis TaxID=159417 RepID=A0ABP0H6I6_CLALP
MTDSSNEDDCSLTSAVICREEESDDALRTSIQILKPRVNGDGLELDEENLMKIFNHPDVDDLPVMLVSIYGAMRQGKSFLLSLLIMYLESCKSSDWLTDKSKEINKHFEWKGGHERNTMGVHVWPKPYILTRKDNSKVAVILMDTQGAFDRSGIRSESNIFAFSTFMSSTQIYNINRQIHENHLQPLSKFAEYAMEVYQSMPNRKEDCAPFQKILFAIRDWPKNSDGYGLEGGQKYIDGHVFKVEEQDKDDIIIPRQRIRKAFKTIECSLLPYPGEIVAGHSEEPVSTIRIGDLDEKFLNVIKVFVSHVFDPDGNTVRSIAGDELKGRDFFNYVAKYHQLLEEGKFNFPQTVMKMKTDYISKNELKKAHQGAKARLAADFTIQFTTEYGDIKSKYREKLKDEIESAYPNHEQKRKLKEAKLEADAVKATRKAFELYKKEREIKDNEKSFEIAAEDVKARARQGGFYHLCKDQENKLMSYVEIYERFLQCLRNYKENAERQVLESVPKIHELHQKWKTSVIADFQKTSESKKEIPMIYRLRKELPGRIDKIYEDLKQEKHLEEEITSFMKDTQTKFVAFYKDEMKEQAKRNNQIDLQQLHEDCRDLALTAFREESKQHISTFGDTAQVFTKGLLSKIESEYKDIEQASRRKEEVIKDQKTKIYREGVVKKYLNYIWKATENVYATPNTMNEIHNNFIEKLKKHHNLKTTGITVTALENTLQDNYQEFASYVEKRKGYFRKSGFMVIMHARVLLGKLRFPVY